MVIFFTNTLMRKLNDDIYHNVPLILENLSKYEGKTIFFPKREENKDFLYKKEIDEAIQIIRTIPGFNSKLLDENYPSLTTSHFNKFRSADYDIIDNHIRIGNLDCISHETLHLASSFYDEKNDRIVSGFSFSDNKFQFGNAFSEGYTEMINQEHFIIANSDQFYPVFVKYTKLFKSVFPNININEFFFTANLNGLLTEIEKYGICKEETITYIYLLSKFSLLNFGIVEAYLQEYINDFKIKTKRIER